MNGTISNQKGSAQQKKLPTNEKATHQMGEEICKQQLQQGVNIQNT